MTQAKPPKGISTQECRGGGFVVMLDGEIYAACAGPHDVAHAMAELLAERDDGRAAAPAPAGGPPLPAASGSDPVPAVVTRPAPAPVALAGSRERLRATASLVLMLLTAGVGSLVGA